MRLSWSLLAVLILLSPGCLDDGPAADEADPVVAAEEESTPPCTPANTNNYGTNVGDLYVEGAEAWRETNGIPNLQKTESCEGPADTPVTP